MLLLNARLCAKSLHALFQSSLCIHLYLKGKETEAQKVSAIYPTSHSSQGLALGFKPAYLTSKPLNFSHCALFSLKGRFIKVIRAKDEEHEFSED